MEETVIKLEDLCITLFTGRGKLPVVDGVSFQLKKGETLGVVGESGCGKSMMASGIMHLVQYPGKITGGKVIFNGHDINKMKEKELRHIRGKDIAMVFQEPMTSLNPLLTCGTQIVETIRAHEKVTAKEAKKRALELIQRVGIPMPEKIYNSMPGSLSGGMRQRIVIAIAMCCNPKLLICDEPTTALDVTVQAQILTMINQLKEESESSVIFISHDIGVISQMADYVMVMYAGQVVEYAEVNEIFNNPLHPYTVGIEASTPDVEEKKEFLDVIEGSVPMLYDLPKGCLFAPRCPYATERCQQERPQLYAVGERQVRCFKYE